MYLISDLSDFAVAVWLSFNGFNFSVRFFASFFQRKKKKNKKLYENLGIYLPLITTNCAVLGINLLNISNNYNLIEAIIYSLGSSLGFTFILYLFSTIREELDKKEINNNYKGVPLALITIAIMAMLFARFTIE